MEGARKMENKLVMKKEVNGYKVSVYCPIDKNLDCKSKILFLLTESYENSLLPVPKNDE